MSDMNNMVARLNKAVEESQAFAHLIIESGTIPGITTPCRCEDCRLVATSMAEAGYLDRQSDRWWETDD